MNCLGRDILELDELEKKRGKGSPVRIFFTVNKEYVVWDFLSSEWVDKGWFRQTSLTTLYSIWWW